MANWYDEYVPVQQQQGVKKDKANWYDEYISEEPNAESSAYYDLPAYQAPPPSRGLFGATNDYVIEAANAVLGGVKSIVDFAQPGTELAASIQRLVEEGESKQSDVAKQSKQALGQALQTDDTLEQLKAVGKYVVESPGLAISQAVGSFVAPGAAIKAARGVGALTGAGTRAASAARAVGPVRPGVAEAAAERALSKYGLAGGSVAGAALSGGDAAGNAYDMVYEGLVNAGVSEEEARAQATVAAREASVVPAAIGGVTGLFGAEAAFAGAASRAPRSILRTGLSEAGQEALEEGATQLSANLAAGQYVDEIPAMRGVVGSAALGAVLGGVTGAGVAAISRQPSSLLGGTNDNLQNTNSPDADNLNNAINKPQQGELFSTEELLSIDEQNRERQAFNPYNVGGFVGAQQAGQDTTMEFTGEGVPAGTQASLLPTAGPTQTVGAPAPAPVPQPQPQQAKGAKQAAPQITQEQAVVTAQRYGLTPVGTAGVQAWDIAGKRIFGLPNVQKFVSELAAADEGKTPDQLAIEAAVIASGLVRLTDQATSRTLISGVAKQLEKLQINAAGTVAEAAAILDQQIQRLAEAGKGANDKNVTALAQLYENLTGQEAPAYALTQTRGVENVQQEQQVPAGVGAVPVEGGARETDGGKLGLVRPGLVQPVGTGSVTQGPVGQQAGQLPAEGVRPSPSVTPAAPVSREPQEEVTEGTPDEKEAFAVRLFGAVFGKQRADMVYDLFERNMSLDEIAAKYGVSRGRISQIKAEYFQKQAKPTDPLDFKPVWADRLRREVEAQGMSREDVLTFLGTTETEAEVQTELEVEGAEDTTKGLAEDVALAQKTDEEIAADERGEDVRIAGSQKNVSQISDVGGKSQVANKIAAARKKNNFTKVADQYLQEGAIKALEDGDTELLNLISEEIARREKIARAQGGRETVEETEGEAEDAVQEQGAAEVPVQPEAEAGEKVGRQVRRIEKPAGKSEAKAETKGEVVTAPQIQGAKVSLLPPVEGFEKQASESFAVEGFGAYIMLFHSTDKNQNIWSIPRLRANKPGEGSGSKLMNAVTTWADKTGATLKVVAAADTQSGKKLSQEDLIKFYEKRGFEPDERSKERIAEGLSYQSLIRYPKAETAQTTEEATQAAYEKLIAMLPEGTAPAWNELTVAQKEALMAIPADQINMRNLQRIADESNVIDVEARVISEGEKRLLIENTNKLSEADTKTLEEQYGAKRGSKEFIDKLYADVTTFVNRGAQYVAENIRSIIQQVAKLAIAAAIVFNPNITGNGFNFNLQDAYAKVHSVEQQVEVPADVAAQMSDEAKIVYQQLAPLAKQQQRGFIIADKKNGKLHMFFSSGQHLASDTALYGKDVGDKFQGDSLKGGKKITPAGKFTLKATEDSGYAGGWRLDLVETSDGNGVIAVHPAWLGDAKEKRLERLASETAEDNRVSYGCINTSHDLFLNKIKPQLGEFDGGMIFVVPDAGFTAEDSVSKVFSAQKLRFESIKDEKAVENAMQQFQDAGIQDIFKLVDQFEIIDPKKVEDAAGIHYVDQNGNTIVGFTMETLTEGTNFTSHTIRHEMGHVVDDPSRGGIYSSNAALSMRQVKGEWIGTGAVARELIGLYNSDPNWSAFLSYPFEAGYDVAETQAELFAQMFSAYLDPQMKSILYSKAPNASKFMEEVIKHVKSSTAVRIRENQERKKQTKREGVRPEREGVRQEQGAVRTYANKAARAERFVNNLPPPARSQAQQIWDTITNFAKKALPTAAFTQDLADLAQKYVPSAKRYFDLAMEQQAKRTEYELRVARILNAYNNLPSAVKGTGPNSVNKFLKDSTTSGKWGYKLKPDSDVQLDPALKARFEAFPPEAQQVIKDVFAHGYNTLQDMKAAVRSNINTEFDALIKDAQDANDDKEVASLQAQKDATLKQYESLLSIAGKRPYAPLKRFGNYVVVGRSQAYMDAEDAKDNKLMEQLQKDENHYFVQFAETFAEAKAIEREEAGRYGIVQAFEKDTAAESIYGGRDLQQIFFRLKNLAKDSFDDKTNQVAVRGINRLINDLHLSMLAESSARNAENRRKNIAGADDDMMRAFATQGRATAHFIGSLTNTGQIYETLREMKKEADARTPGRDERRRYYNEFMKRHAMGFDYEPSPIINKALAATSAWMLLTNPAYYLQNLTQPIMMSIPYMAGKHGYAASNGALFKAYEEVAALVKGVSIGEKFDFSKLPDDVREAMQELAKRGRIDISLEQDLGSWESVEDSKFAMLKKTSGFLKNSAQKIEMINRVATAIAAYRLEKQRGSGDLAATNYADKVIRVTHGDYSGANAPRFMRAGVGRLVTQFRKFQLIQISMMARMFNDAFKGATPEERMAGRKALLWTLTHAGVMGGIMGLPGFAAIAAVYGALFGDEDEPENPELALRRFFGDDLGTLMTKGLPAAMGVDVSGKVGMGQMLSILPYTDLTDLNRSNYEKLVTASLGPFVGGLGPRVVDGLGYFREGNLYRGFESIMPAGVAQTLKAYRLATEGVTQRNNDVTLSADEITALDAMLVALGLPTTKLTEQQFRTGAKIKFEKFFDDRTSDIKKAYAKAYRSNDAAGMAEAREDWKKLQDSKVREGFKRQPLSNLLKAPREQRKRERQTVGGVQFDTGTRRFVRELPQ